MLETGLDGIAQLGREVDHVRGADLAVIPKKEKAQLAEVVRLRVDPALLERLDSVADAEDRSRSDVMRLLMIAGLEQYEAERGGKKK